MVISMYLRSWISIRVNLECFGPNGKKITFGKCQYLNLVTCLWSKLVKQGCMCLFSTCKMYETQMDVNMLTIICIKMLRVPMKVI